MTKSSPRLIDAYEEILAKLAKMLELADQGLWDQFFSQPTAILTNQKLMAFVHETRTLEKDEQVEAHRLLSNIIDAQQTIKDLLMRRRDELAMLIESAKLQESRGGLGQVIHSDTYDLKDLYRHRRS